MVVADGVNGAPVSTTVPSYWNSATMTSGSVVSWTVIRVGALLTHAVQDLQEDLARGVRHPLFILGTGAANVSSMRARFLPDACTTMSRGSSFSHVCTRS